MATPDWEKEMPPSITKIFESFGDIQDAAKMERTLQNLQQEAVGLLPPSEQAKLDTTAFADRAEAKVRTVFELFRLNDPAEMIRCAQMINDPDFVPVQSSQEWGPDASGAHVLQYFVSFAVKPDVYERWLVRKLAPPAAIAAEPAETPLPETTPLHACAPLPWSIRLRLWLLSPLGRG